MIVRTLRASLPDAPSSLPSLPGAPSLARALLPLAGMADVVLLQRSVVASGQTYRLRVLGRLRPDGMWEGWMEFDPDDGSPAVRTERETTQPNLADLHYWATGLTPVYLEGALRRALDAGEPVPEREAGPDTGPIGPVRGAVLDPFAVHVRGEAMLRRQLGALGRHHLLGIVAAYDLADGGADALTTAELIELIVARVTDRRAA